ncbi:hypothetical protein MHYP_G00170730 [Metynnis hypsauchen]
MKETGGGARERVWVLLEATADSHYHYRHYNTPNALTHLDVLSGSAGTIQTSSWITAIFLLTNFYLSVDHYLDVDRDFRKASLICSTESWWTEDITNIELEGYSLIRYDGDPRRTVKRTGGGLCMFTNTSWATTFTVHDIDCSTHYDIMTVSFPPHYLPCEFRQVTVMLVYMPGPDSASAAEHS